jgi:hypothetical protein
MEHIRLPRRDEHARESETIVAVSSRQQGSAGLISAGLCGAGHPVVDIAIGVGDRPAALADVTLDLGLRVTQLGIELRCSEIGQARMRDGMRADLPTRLAERGQTCP